MPTYKKLAIKSRIHNYSALFIGDLKHGLRILQGKKLFFIVDARIARLYRDALRPVMRSHPHMVLEASERIKTLDYAKVIIKRLIDSNIRKDFILVAIGGGAIQDITAFVASILYRGIKWVFLPTTLLAQCDSCIGSKTSINVDAYKNQVGNFYPPELVILNVNFLKTLPQPEIKSGMGEIIKVHLLDSIASMRFIIKNYDASLTNPKVMNQLILKSLLIKKGFIEKDEFDTGYRNIMNYGHTFGHALESLTRYRLSHGQAVTIGMDISNYLSWKLGYIRTHLYKEMKKLLLKNWPDYLLKDIDLKAFFNGLARDKKNTGNKITMILTKGPGRMIKESLPRNGKFRKLIRSYFSPR